MRIATLYPLVGVGFLGLFGCVEPAPSTDTVEICDSSGCSETVSYTHLTLPTIYSV